GVGFRPFVYRRATALGLAGTVRNTGEGVEIDVEGPSERIEDLLASLKTELPPLARTESIAAQWIPALGMSSGFSIVTSASRNAGGTAGALIPADVATCEACLRELADPSDRRYSYPFVNCTDCGPRFTISTAMPYDRCHTTMSAFSLCAACRAEYEDPQSRRFHAEPNACPCCGPRAWLADRRGVAEQSAHPIGEAAERLAGGWILAIKGIGGFHLAADARAEQSVARLRFAKQRDRKPFALMALDLAAVNEIAVVQPAEAALLASIERPVVLLERRLPSNLAGSVAPGCRLVGVMLPYSPLHHLLLGRCREAGIEALVLTSANERDEPIVKDNEEAIVRLGDGETCDGFLLHDREIAVRADDSVAMVAAGAPRLIRRSRGHVPRPVAIPIAGPPVVAAGGDSKNTCCVTRGSEAFLGPHVGDVENPAACAMLDTTVGHLCELLGVVPVVIAHDLHPDYSSTRLARGWLDCRFRGARLVPVQHHYAHILSCLAENGTQGPAIGIAADGAGYGNDGTVWGGEVFVVSESSWQRLAHFGTIPLPGGDRAAKDPWRIATATMCELGCQELVPALAERWQTARFEMLRTIMALTLRQQGSPWVRTSSLGRLFDVASAIAGLASENTYEGEAAVALEHAASTVVDRPENLAGAFPPYPFELRSPDGDGPLAIDVGRALVAAGRAAANGEPAAVIGARFHATIVAALTAAVQQLASSTGIGVVALSGGCFQNRLLLSALSARLVESGLTVLSHRSVPANDGGLALGQAVAALRVVAAGGGGGGGGGHD
ncbi:MAG: carbamoyltransferase HypF, partial [Pseudomonadota bacterium]